MKQQMLTGGWNLLYGGEKLPAHVPCSVYGDLLGHGKMADPFYRDNETHTLPLMEEDYTYVLQFNADPALLAYPRVLLRCEGLDTLATLVLNGEEIGRADNMHRTWEYSVKGTLREAGNTLEIVFHSPTQYIREQAARRGHLASSPEAMDGYPYLRKAHCMFGWDWGPRLPDAGIWRDISLVGMGRAHLDDVHIRQRHTPGRVELDIAVAAEPRAGTSYKVSVTDPDGGKTVSGGSPTSVAIGQPRLWWPNGYGEQPLYTVRVELEADGEAADVWEKRIGLRTMTVRREKDGFGESFAHEVNGVAVFAMGADYIPEDSLLPRVTRERTRKLLEQCVAAHFNVVRVWGGGHFPSDSFYDDCDELGLAVWQDMMFACAVYELDDAFEENLRAEFSDNIRRVRHHACLGLWCGNNEMEGIIDAGGWEATPRQKGDYTKIFGYILPKMLKELDPDTFYWPSSPSSGGDFDSPQDESRGDAHCWQVWHGNRPFTDYRDGFSRYVSEFGFQSFPAMKTIESFTIPEDHNIFSYVMEKHQRNNDANGKIMGYLARTFLYPTRFDTLVYASQLLQAEAVRYGVEHWRRNRGRCMGAVVWQLNDCWPVASWSSIDYFGRWKALHYFEKRFFAPIMLSCCEEGLLTQDANPNAEPYEVKKSIRLNVANETMKDQSVIVRWALRNNRSDILIDGGETPVTVPKLSSVWLKEVYLPLADLYGDYVSYACYQGGERVSGGTVIFSVPKHFRFVDPRLTARVEGDEVVVTSKAYARGVELLNDDEDWVLSDNYFDMDAGETRVKILSGTPSRVRVRSVYDIR